MSSALSDSRSLQTLGYFIHRSVLSPSLLEDLRTAADVLISHARAGAWPFVRTVGKQFPPWPPNTPDSEHDIWGVQHLLHPDVDTLLAAVDERLVGTFQRLYTDPALLGIISSAYALPPSSFGLELLNMLTNPLATPTYSLVWHRDTIPFTVTEEEEEAMLQIPEGGTQWNLALADEVDGCLLFVPGSHLRPRTDWERREMKERGEHPEQVKVELHKGDIVVYNNNLLHRGVYTNERKRVTLHGSYGLVGTDQKYSLMRARNILQHAVGRYVDNMTWTAGESSEEAKAQKGTFEGMRKRLLDLRAEVDDGEEVFSLEG